MTPGDNLSIRSATEVIGGKFLYYNANDMPHVKHILVDKKTRVVCPPGYKECCSEVSATKAVMFASYFIDQSMALKKEMNVPCKLCFTLKFEFYRHTQIRQN